MIFKDHPTIIVIPIIIAAAGLAWNVGYNTSENRVKLLEAQISARNLSDSLNLPKLLTDLRLASQQLGTGLEIIRRIDTLQKIIESANNRENQLNLKIKSIEEDRLRIEDSLQKSEKIVHSLYTEVKTFTVYKGSSQDLLGFELAVGLQEVGLSDVDIIFDNKKSTLQPGGQVVAIKRGKKCILGLNNLNFPGNAEFTFFVIK